MPAKPVVGISTVRFYDLRYQASERENTATCTKIASYLCFLCDTAEWKSRDQRAT